MTKVAFSEKYFESLMDLTPKEQSQATKAMMLFQQNPQHSSLHYEKLNAVKDDKLRSIRANQDIRIILATTDNNDLYLMLYVGHHQPAYEWAAKRKVAIHPNTGSVQVFTVNEQAISSGEPSTLVDEGSPQGLFDALRDRQLLQLGVPEDSLPLVRKMRIEADLEEARVLEHIPPEAYEGLFVILAGGSYEEAFNEINVERQETVDTADYAKALTRPESLAHFAVAENEDALQTVLNQSLEKWRVFLHPAQRRLAEGLKNGSVRVLGGAGTGKTVVAMHRARWLAEHALKSGEHVLFTTFTRNLAADIQQNLNKICTPEQLARIEVRNLDSWVMRFLKQQGYDYGPLNDSRVESRLWEEAMGEKPAHIDLPTGFFREEWARVIQPQSIRTLDQYKRASRIGRGTRLNRQQRVDIWPVFGRYRHLLSRNFLKETDDQYRDARELIENQPELRPNIGSVIVDEAQDMGTQGFMLLRSLVPEGPNDLFIVGDGHQRIYGKNKVVLSQCGINIRGRSARLKVNYRTTDETRKLAVGILEGITVDDLDGGEDTQAFYHSLMHGPEPEFQQFETREQQAERILSVIQSEGLAAESCCVIARTRKEVEALRETLSALQQPCHTLDGRTAETPAGALNLATMHRVKGLEFDAVFLASANQGMLPLSFVVNSASDAVSQRQRENEERALVYVSLTRARKLAYVYAFGAMSKVFTDYARK